MCTVCPIIKRKRTDDTGQEEGENRDLGVSAGNWKYFKKEKD